MRRILTPVSVVLAVGLVACTGQRAEDAYLEGKAMFERRDYAGAARQAAKATQLAPNEPRYHHAFAVALANLGHLDQAETEVRKALELKPDYSDASRTLTLIRRRIENRQAGTLADEVASRFPQ